MKKLLLLLCISLSATIQAQDTLRNIEITYLRDVSEFPPYIIGDSKEYKLEIRQATKEEIVILPNGRTISGLGAIVNFEDDYIGGVLESGNKKTKIIDLVFLSEGAEVKLIVVGKKFSREMTLANSYIMELDNKHAVIKTSGLIWLIQKRV